MTLNVERHQDYITEVQAKYADAWACALVGKRDADMRRRSEQPLGYYVHDMVRRILADIGLEDPILLKRLMKRLEKRKENQDETKTSS
jgi:ethanolamine utilization cobalamin adenosyltransferase